MRYLGNKGRLAKELVPILTKHLNETNTYIEPFAGACGMITKIPHPRKIGTDSDKYIIVLMQALQDGWQPPVCVSEELYRQAREDAKNNTGNLSDFLIGFIAYGCSFGGKWFGGYARGDGRNMAAESARNGLKMASELQGIKLGVCDYRDIGFRKGDVYYLDPPYGTGTQYKNAFNSEEFFQWVRLASKENYVYISEYNAPSDFKAIWEKSHKTGLDRNLHKPTMEKLFIWNNPESLLQSD